MALDEREFIDLDYNDAFLLIFIEALDEIGGNEDRKIVFC